MASRNVGVSPRSVARAIISGGSGVSGNVVIFGTNGVSLLDSGVALVSTMSARTVWSNNSSSAAAPAANTVLTLGDGTESVPTYAFGTSVGTGIWSSATGVMDFSAATHRAFQISTSTGTNWVQLSNNSTPTFAVGGTGNVALQLAGLGTGGVTLRAGSAIVGQFSASSSNVNYPVFNSSATGAAVTNTMTGSDTNISYNIIPKGTGALQTKGFSVPYIAKLSGTDNSTAATTEASGIQLFCNIPAGELGTNGQIVVEAIIDSKNSTQAVNVVVRLVAGSGAGTTGTALIGTTIPTNQHVLTRLSIQNANSASAQTSNNNLTASWTSSTNSLGSAAIDTTSACAVRLNAYVSAGNGTTDIVHVRSFKVTILQG